MSTELRRVPKDWKHPKDERGQYIPLYDWKDWPIYRNTWNEFIEAYGNAIKLLDFYRGNTTTMTVYKRMPNIYGDGSMDDTLNEHIADMCTMDIDEYLEKWEEPFKPHRSEYMRIKKSEATHWQWYETSTEGTPISPIFKTEKQAVSWHEKQ